MYVCHSVISFKGFNGFLQERLKEVPFQPATAQESTQWLPVQYFWEVCKAHDIFDLTGLILLTEGKGGRNFTQHESECRTNVELVVESMVLIINIYGGIKEPIVGINIVIPVEY